MIKRCYSIFKNRSPPLLGRWGQQGDVKSIQRKVDLANHDSCGGPLCNSVPTSDFEKKDDEGKGSKKDYPDDDVLRFYLVSSFHVDTERIKTK